MDTASINPCGHRSPTGLDGGLHWSTRDSPVTSAGASPGPPQRRAARDRCSAWCSPGPRQSKITMVSGRGTHASYLSIGDGYRHALFVCPPPHTSLRAGQGVEKKKQKSRPFLLEPLSRGDVCALSCSISRAAYISHPPRVRYGPPFRRAAATSCLSWPSGNKKKEGDPPYP